MFIDSSLTTAYTAKIEINPSVTFFVNKKDEVIKAEANNGSAAQYDLIALKGENISDALFVYFSALSKDGIISGDKNSDRRIHTI